MVTEPTLLSAFSNHHELKIMVAHRQKRFFELGQRAHAFLRGKASDISNPERASLSIAKLRPEDIRIDSVRHHETRFACRRLKGLHNFMVWREKKFRDFVIPGRGAKGCALERVKHFGSHHFWNEWRSRFRAA